MTFFRKIGLALAFSPRMKALLLEALRIRSVWNSELVLIHVGGHGEDEEKLLSGLLAEVGVNKSELKVVWRKGKPADEILAACKSEKVDLLIAGALKKENLFQYYLGTVARKILRKADCSVLMFTNPSENPKTFQNLVVNAEDSLFVDDALHAACSIGVSDKSNWLHVVREIKMYGLTMSAAEQRSEDEYDALRHSLVKDEIDNVEKILQRIPHEGLKVNIKMVSGKSGFELVKFAQRKSADLLIVGAAQRRLSLFDRVFPHDLEYIFADLPCNLLIINPRNGNRKEESHG